MYNEEDNNEDNKDKKDNKVSLYNYNMMFNKIGSYNKDNDKINIDTNFVNDIDLRNFNPKQYEYYKKLIKIYNEDPEILYNLLNKFNSIKYMKEKEKKIIKEIYNIAVKSPPIGEGTNEGKSNYNPSNWKEYLIKELTKDSKSNSDKKDGITQEQNFKNVDINTKDNDRDNRNNFDDLERSSRLNNNDNIFNTDGSYDNSKKLFDSKDLDKSIIKGIDLVKLLSTIEDLDKYIKDGNKKGSKIIGGDNYDDILKAKYLNTQKYNKIDEDKIKTLRDENKKSVIKAIKTNNKIEQLSNDIDIYNGSDDKKKQQYKDLIINKIKEFENDPKNPIQELAITFDDRIVFIIVTFLIRYVSLIMVQWCIDINIIKTFYEGFIYYAIIYIILFWFVVLFVNIDNSYDVKYINFNGIINSIRSLFYNFYMGTNGISRLLVHTSLILLLIIIPIILNIKKKSEYIDDEQKGTILLTIEERKQLSKSLSLFTIFIWLFTSIIATKF